MGLIPRPGIRDWDGKGNPPAGTECEYRTRTRGPQSNVADDWENCLVQYASEKGAFILDKDREEVFMDSMDYSIEFRPIRSPEQKLRKELAEFIEAAMANAPAWTGEAIADVLMPAFDTKRKK
jgi:hypothetical protein